MEIPLDLTFAGARPERIEHMLAELYWSFLYKGTSPSISPHGLEPNFEVFGTTGNQNAAERSNNKTKARRNRAKKIRTNMWTALGQSLQDSKE